MTTTRRLALVLMFFLAGTPAAYAWSWPVQGQVLRPFAFDEAHPYAAGQHRGDDIGADAGETVVAPAAGTITFAGTVPTNGESATIQTADGYSVTLTHLGSIGVAKGAAVDEGDAIGTVGPSGTPEVDGPYVHLGIRVTADPNGYVDPLGLLPPAPAGATDDTGSTTSQPASGGTSAVPPARKATTSARRSPRVPTTAGQSRTRVHQQAQEPRSDAPATRPRQRPVRTSEEEQPRARPHQASGSTSSSRRPVVEPAAPGPIGLDAGHAIRSTALAAQARLEPSAPVLGLVCNLAAALLAVGAALSAGRRRRHLKASPVSSVRVLRHARPEVERRRFSRAA